MADMNFQDAWGMIHNEVQKLSAYQQLAAALEKAKEVEVFLSSIDAEKERVGAELQTLEAQRDRLVAAIQETEGRNTAAARRLSTAQDEAREGIRLAKENAAAEIATIKTVCEEAIATIRQQHSDNSMLLDAEIAEKQQLARELSGIIKDYEDKMAAIREAVS